MTRKNLLALAVLSYLTQGPMHPYELSRTLRDNGDARSIRFTHSSLYMVVQQLAKAGLIEAQETTRDGQRPERTVYALTGSGRTEVRDWLRELVSEPRHEYPDFVAALSLIGALPPDEVVELLHQRAVRLAALRAEAREQIDVAMADGVHPLFVIEEEYRVAMVSTEIDFVSEFIQKIQTQWGPLWTEFHSTQKGQP